ncbi:C-8 sterol isomerase Erg2 [Taphrina deformans PYCC 5710]|uniref:C-8 sterol isomerase n=1 Tax=Taphrina deformans (strain PYCC 5710 / ATCC 11124 / CBS 356.35 / IMI 108563 / JCM 9778 / NBRC 8474) TaxID=1097556 RepID=R4X8Z3_TAPDE|nr:C-8 sterol isomerase Erg2 [Taphrina deformans PYCC 5710]|eukprot:CCG80617.1 C-8 sterol isomerase Erg2 [Taphrina deformans PYCC 5710]
MLFKIAAVLFFLSPIFYLLDSQVHTQFVFKPDKLQELSKIAIAQHANETDPTALFTTLTQLLRGEYGDAVQPWTADDWFFNNAGGAMGSMVILHASITEYLIFFGTALQTEGHSGIHMADDYFTILYGHQHAASASDVVARIYGPGDQNHLRRGQGIQYSMPQPCFALELAQGWIPAMLPFGFMDTFSSTLDWWNLWKTVKMTAIGMGRQAIRGKF